MSPYRFDRAHELVLNEALTQDQIRRRLQEVGLVDWQGAYKRLVSLAEDEQTRALLADCLPALMSALNDAATPDPALISFERFVQGVPNRKEWFHYFRTHPRAIEMLIRIVVGSQFLAEILISNPDYLKKVAQHRKLAELKSRDQFFQEAQDAVEGLKEEEEQLDALRRIQRWELLRLGACDCFATINLKAVTIQLSLLADSLVQACLALGEKRTGRTAEGFAVLAMGKLGGEELNYSSDIDLIFLARENANSYSPLGQRLIRGLIHPTQSGFLYRVDMRLRPWGNSGPLVATVESHLEYLRTKAMLWEKQALLKARVIAGDFALGQGFLREAQPMIFNSPPDAVRANVKSMKAKIEAELEHRGKKWGEVKSGTGSIRDIEFVTQYLQLVNGGENPAVRSFNTLNALIRLTDFSLVQADEYRLLTDGYIFLRKIEHALQLLHNKQTHNLPTDPQELSYLAMRLDFETGEQFLNHYERYCTAIRRIYDRYFSDLPQLEAEETPAQARVLKHLARMEHDYSLAFDEDEISQHARLAQQLDGAHLVEVEAEPLENGDWKVTIIAYDYLGELSLICGLMFVYGLDIVDGDVFTYEAVAEGPTSPKTIGRPKVKSPARPPTVPKPKTSGASSEEAAKKIVDVFTVRPMQPATADTFVAYRNDLHELLKLLKAGKQTEAQGMLANRVATILRDTPARQTPLYPVDIDIDNSQSEQFTLLRISAPDTIGFLYELSNALALNGVYVSRVHFKALGNHAYDILYVTDQHGRKIVGEREQLELRAATLLTKQFTHLLPRSSNPEGALLHFREFISQLFSRSDWITELSSLTRPEVLDALAQLLGVSDFLWNDFLRMQHANLFPVVKNVEDLAERFTPERLRKDLQKELQEAKPGEERVLVLNSFKDRVMFRIDMRHILGHIPEFGQFSRELTDAAEVVVEAACEMCELDLQARYGIPKGEDGVRCPYVVCALGKCGGRELGFASDIELMFLYDGVGQTTGGERITTTEYYLKLVEAVTHTIRTKHEGIFQVDLRLRPYGNAGPLAVSIEAFQNYFGIAGPAWPYERQALVKLRPICGDLKFGKRLVEVRDKLIYSKGAFEVQAMRGMRERQLRQLVTPGTFNAKFSPGGLVDIEYLVQGLQMLHAEEFPEIKETNTQQALQAMRQVGMLSEANFLALTSGYVFLRRLIDALRVVRGDAKDLTVPDPASEEFQFLGRRLGYGEEMVRLSQEITEHATRVQQINGALLS